jgi:hypothetical protein
MLIGRIGPLGGDHFGDPGFTLPELFCDFDDAVHQPDSSAGHHAPY